MTDDKRFREILEDWVPGIEDPEIEILMKAAKAEVYRPSNRRRNRSVKRSTKKNMEGIYLRGMVRMIDAFNDPEVTEITGKPQEAKKKLLIELIRFREKTSWTKESSKQLLLLPSKQFGSKNAVDVGQLKDLEPELREIAQELAKRSQRVSAEFMVDPEYVVLFMLWPVFFKPIAPVHIVSEDIGLASGDGRIVLSIAPEATDEEVCKALMVARKHLKLPGPNGAKRRQPREKTLKLARFLAWNLTWAFGKEITPRHCQFQNCSLRFLLKEWNSSCEADGKHSWAYLERSNGSNPEHQFSRDLKNALASVRGSKARYPMRFRK